MPTKASTPKKTLTKSTKSKSKSRIAGLSALNKKRKFNWKIAIVIVAVLAVALGYLFVRLSQAGSDYTWASQYIGFRGSYAGTREGGVIQSQYEESHTTGSQVRLYVNSKIDSNARYCFNGATKEGNSIDEWEIKAVYINDESAMNNLVQDALYSRAASVVNGKNDEQYNTGNNRFSICADIPAPANNAERNTPRYITFYAHTDFTIKRSNIDRAFYVSSANRSPVVASSGPSSGPSDASLATSAPAPAAPAAPAQPDASLGAASPAPAPPAPAPNTPDCANMNNGIGNQNFCVSMIQLKLKQLGYGIEVDGIYGQKTADNVKLFQQKTGLTQDGVVGPRTWARMVQANNCSDPAAKQGCTL